MLKAALPLAIIATLWGSGAGAHTPKGAAATSAPSLSPAAADAAATVDAFHAALSRGDREGALALLADDVLILEGDGVERSKAEYAAHHLAADVEFSQAVPSTMARRTGAADAGLAWIASEGRITGRFKAKPVDRITAETMLLRRVGREWRITHIHWSSAVAPSTP